jgi:hypothetical protein
MRKLMILAVMLAVMGFAVYPAVAGATDDGGKDNPGKGKCKEDDKGNNNEDKGCVDPKPDPEPPKDGKDGTDGRDGRSGNDGQDGQDGRDFRVGAFGLDDDLFDDLLDDLEDFNGGGEQEAESGDVDQTFTVTNTGDNSNQCVGLQGVANTGNAQNQGFGDADVEVSPNNSTDCNQSVNQAATSSVVYYPYVYYYPYW